PAGTAMPGGLPAGATFPAGIAAGPLARIGYNQGFRSVQSMPLPPRKIMIGLSGGVDSAVAALQLLEQGHEVEALFMKKWEEDDSAEYCAAAVDLEDAAAVCARLGIPLHTINFSAEYWDRVFEYFLAEYRA